jgi:ATP-dependent DNA ligase
MLSKSEPEIPRGDGWTYEPKWDGFRAIVAVEGSNGEPVVRVVSRDGKPLGRYFPEVLDQVARRSGGRSGGSYVADGEIVMVRPGGMEFDELQLRLHPAASRVAKLAREIPATLILFDLLHDDGADLRPRPLVERRARLGVLAKGLAIPEAPDRLDDVPAGPVVLLAPWTDDVATAERWFADDAGIGQDGVVAKRSDQAYLSGERGWVKVKHRRTIDCVVGGYRVAKNGDGVGSLLLGLYDDDGVLQYVGHTSSFKAAERREVRANLAPLEGGASFGFGRAPGGPSRWSGGRDTEWVTVDAVLVCEVSFERLQSGRFRHAATFLRWRPDRDARSCTFEQLSGSAGG